MKKYFPFAAFVMVALASLAMAAFAFLAGEEAARFKFEASADDALNRVESRIDLQISMLRAARGMFAAAGASEVTRDEFKAFFDALGIEELEGLRGMGFLGVARAGDTASLENRIRDYHGADRRIFPESEQELKTPILLFEPLDSATEAGIGFDMYTDPLRRAAIQAAIDTGQPRASEHLTLGESAGGETDAGFLVFYSLDLPETVAAPAGPASAGILYEAIRTADLLESALKQFPPLPVHAEIYGADTTPEKMLFQSSNVASEEFGDDFLVTRKLIVAGQPWTMQLRPTADFSRPTQRGVPIMLGVFGLLLAGAMAIAARYQMRAFAAVSLLHEATEKSLGDKDLMLQEMKHRIKNSITRVLAIARQTASGSKDIAEFSASFAARLQAMAASQDMLTRSRWQKADLAELLRIELGQVFGNELPDDMLSGPKVLLSETETQALGLTFHELATNALKYGEAGNSVDALKVTWTLPREARETLLTLRWEEMARQQIEPPAKPGFGTKLIDMNIRHELGGAIRREYRDDGLVIEIDIPLSARRMPERR